MASHSKRAHARAWARPRPARLLPRCFSYGCDDLPAQFVDAPTQSADMPCTRLRYAWAVGGGPFCLPDRVGIPFDVDSAEDAWHVLEIHYDNPQRRAGLRDSSGVRLTLVDDGDAGGAYARAGFLWIGAALSKLRIPPGQRAHHVEARCAFPQLRAETRVTAFASMLHAHTLARAVWTEVHRAHGGGHAYAHDAGCSMAYDFDLQEMVPLPAPVSLGPSDTLVANCVYDSSARSDVTRGGDETADEMCLTFLLYYPEVQVCVASAARGAPSRARHAPRTREASPSPRAGLAPPAARRPPPSRRARRPCAGRRPSRCAARPPRATRAARCSPTARWRATRSQARARHRRRGCTRTPPR